MYIIYYYIIMYFTLSHDYHMMTFLTIQSCVHVASKLLVITLISVMIVH